MAEDQERKREPSSSRDNASTYSTSSGCSAEYISTIPTVPAYFVSGTSRLDNKKARDPVIVERRNLVNISKLIVKELLDTSNKYGRMLDSDHMTLQHFFIVLEHVLRHGLRPKRGLLGPKKELWDILQLVDKLIPEAQDITSNVKNLPVRTHMGRARAWLRIALMQKKLAEYIKILVDHREDILSEYFEPDALMMSDEAIVIVGLLVGLDVLDCNLCIKEEDLDCEMGVIDFSLYLRSNHQVNNVTSPIESHLEVENMTTVLDQKSYIEELNRHLKSTVTSLQAKVEELSTSNALMKEDLEVARENVTVLMQENTFLKAQKCYIDSDNHSEQEDSKFEILPVQQENLIDFDRMQQELKNEKKVRRDLEKELNILKRAKAEMEVAMESLERDVHEKQDTIISLRKQLEDIKQINLEMYRKLQECEEELTQKAEVVSRLQMKTLHIGEMLSNLQKYDSLSKFSNDDFSTNNARKVAQDKYNIPPFKKTYKNQNNPIQGEKEVEEPKITEKRDLQHESSAKPKIKTRPKSDLVALNNLSYLVNIELSDTGNKKNTSSMLPADQITEHSLLAEFSEKIPEINQITACSGDKTHTAVANDVDRENFATTDNGN